MEAVTFLIVIGVVLYFTIFNTHLLKFALQFFIFNLTISSLFLFAITFLLFFSNNTTHAFFLL